MTAENLTSAEMKKLESALKKLLVIRVNSWVHVTADACFQDGSTHNGSVVAIEKRKVMISFKNGDVLRIPRKFVKLGHDPKYQLDDRRVTYVDNLMWTALDFQMNVDVVDNSMLHFHLRHGKINRLEALERVVRQYPDTKSGNMELARELWGNNHWTRAEFSANSSAPFGNGAFTASRPCYGGWNQLRGLPPNTLRIFLIAGSRANLQPDNTVLAVYCLIGCV